MLLTNEFVIDAGIDEAWALLTDLERIAPCMPGAALEGRDGDDFIGGVKIKVGPIGAHFKGSARFIQKDDDAKSAVILGAGKDPKGQASANAKIHARLESISPTSTKVLIDTDLDISGRMAQFGRGAIADVSNRLIGQFTQNLSREIQGGAAPAAPSAAAQGAAAQGAAAPTSTTAQSAAFTAPSAAAAPAGDASMDVMSIIVPMVKERYGQAIAGALIGLALSWLAFGRRVPR